MKNSHTCRIVTGLSLVALALTTSLSHATPYASGIKNQSGTISFFINEDADDVKVVFDGPASTNEMGPLTRGLHSFSLAGSTYSIIVSNTAASGYTLTDATGTNAIKLPLTAGNESDLNFEQPRGLRVNQNPASPYFGRIYVGNARSSGTVAGRQMAPGVYMINPDLTSAHPSGEENIARRPGNWPLLGTGTSTNFFPYNIHIGADDKVYVADWNNSTGNLWWTDPECADGGGAVLKLLSAVDTAVCPVGSANTHGSISAAHIEGSLAGGNLNIWTMDEDLQENKTTSTRTQLNSIWHYNIGGSSLPYQNDGVRVWTPAVGGIKDGINTSAQTSEIVRSTNGFFYVGTLRSAGNESGVTVVSNGVTVWYSHQASLALGFGADRLFNTRRVAISRDNKWLAVLRSSGYVRLIPMVNGIPVLSSMRTMQPFSGTTTTLDNIDFDAAGNLYVSSRGDEYVYIFSPGGETVATTTSSGQFFVTTPTMEVTVNTSTPAINENAGANSGVFTITRAGNLSNPLTVFYTFSGTATNPTHYTTLGSGSVTIAASQASTNIFITPVNNTVAEFTKTVILTVEQGVGYTPAAPSAATISILDNEGAEVAFTPVVAKKLLESYATSKVTYELTRKGLLTSALTVNLGYSGAATRTSDFNGPITIGIDAGSASTNITLTSLDDQSYEGDENAVVTITAGTGYAVGASNNVSAIVVDDEYQPGTLLFSDNFEVNSSSSWKVNSNSASCFVDFAWDYGVNAGIPAAPGSATTKGLRMRCGNTTLIRDAVSLSPLGGNFIGNYRLKFNMWINYNGPMPDGGPGSTQNFATGVGTSGNGVIWPDNGSSDGVWFAATGDGADGATGGDYNAFIGATLQNDDSGVYSAGVGAANGGLRNAGHEFYSYWGGVSAPAQQLIIAPGQTGVANTGNAGMAWHTVVVTKTNDVVTWNIDGITVATITNNVGMSTNVFVGYYDIFATGNLSDAPQMSFGLIDNLRVETMSVTAPPTLSITRNGNSITLNWSGSYVLQRATVLTGSPLDWSDIAGSSGFTETATGNSYFRLRSN
jgi:hypothetical protein